MRVDPIIKRYPIYRHPLFTFRTFTLQGFFSNISFFDNLSFDDAISKNLKVMDATALTLARDHALPINVFNVNNHSALKDIICGKKVGTLIS